MGIGFDPQGWLYTYTTLMKKSKIVDGCVTSLYMESDVWQYNINITAIKMKTKKINWWENYTTFTYNLLIFEINLPSFLLLLIKRNKEAVHCLMQIIYIYYLFVWVYSLAFIISLFLIININFRGVSIEWILKMFILT